MGAKAKKRRQPLSARVGRDYPQADFGPGVVLDRGDRVIEHPTGRDGVRRARARFQCVLDVYHNRCQIDDRQWAAGMRLREQCDHARVGSPKITDAYSGTGGGGGGAADAVLRLDGMRSVRTVLLALTPEQRNLVIEVCAGDAWASERLPMLRQALTRIADYWRLPSEIAAA